jgi:hypothetical protein
VPDSLAGIDAFDGNHSVYAQGATLRADGTIPIDDSLTLNVKFWPLTLLERYTKKLGRAQGLPQGWVYVTRVRQALPKPVPPPPPPPPPPAETPEEAVVRLTGELDAANAANAALTEQLASVTAERDGLAEQIDQWEAYRDAVRALPAPGEEPQA